MAAEERWSNGYVNKATRWSNKFKTNSRNVLHSMHMAENSELPIVEAPIKEELHALLEQEELKWKQWAKENWLKFGDRNTKYYHACGNQKKRSQILKIKDKDGRMCTSQEDIEATFVSYYKELFTVGEELDVEACIGALDRKVTPMMN
jgi:hypothetical protein